MTEQFENGYRVEGQKMKRLVLPANDVPKKIRFDPLDPVMKEFSRVRTPFIVFKPLVGGQNV